MTKRVALLGVPLLILLIVGGVYLHIHKRPKPVANQPIIKSAPVKKLVVSSYATPVELQIPKIGLKARIQSVGLTADGNMGVPTNIVDVGWFNVGARPGNKGSAVIDGHLDGPVGQPAVFWNLIKLKVGDKIIVKDSKGQLANFIVRSTKEYAQSEHPSEVFKSSSGKHLNLITCSGAWDASSHSFVQRLVVFADLSV